MENNGRASIKKRPKHINSRYLFIMDQINQGYLDVEYGTTEKMWAEVLNNTKKGELFRDFRGDQMNV